MRRLEEDDGLGRVRDAPEVVAPIGPVTREEPHETKAAVVGEAAPDERREHRARAGQGHDGEAPRDGPRDERAPRIAHGGGPGVGRERHVVPSLEEVHDGVDVARGGMRVDPVERLARDPEVREELPRAARVLGGHVLHPREHLASAAREVAEVPDGGRDHEEGAGGVRHQSTSVASPISLFR